ncbi:retrovirus-related pol polyprotein from transposon TNT 1-94 [Tanacetum coccineum]
MNFRSLKEWPKNANPLALVATAQTMQDPYYQTPKHHKSYAPTSKASLPTRSHAATRYKGKEIAKPITPPSESAFEEDSDSLNKLQKTKYVEEFGSHCKVLQETLQTYQQQPPPQGYFLKHQEQECGYYTKVQELTNQTGQFWIKHGNNYTWQRVQGFRNADSCTDASQWEQWKRVDSNVIPDSPDMCDNDIQNDQHDVECDDERVALANLIANLKLDVDDNKKIQKQLKKANATLTQELTECKSILAETSRTLGESNSIRDSCLVALQNKQTEFERLLKVKAYEISVVQAKHDELVKQSLLTRSHYEGLVKEKTKVITDLKLREDKDIDKMISMEHQIKFLNEIVYKRGQSIQTIQMLAPKCSTFNGRPTFANPMYHKKAQSKAQPARLIPDSEEILTLADASRSKLNKDLVKPFDYTKLNSLYEIFKPPTQHYEIQFAQANEIRKKMWRKSFVKTKPNVFKNIDFLPVSKSVSKNMEILVKKCLMPLALKTQNDSLAFIHELKKEMHADLKYVESLEDELDELESDKAEFSNMYDMLLQECVSKDVMCSYLLTSSDLDEITELQCLYLHKVMECDCLAQNFLNKLIFLNSRTSNANAVCALGNVFLIRIMMLNVVCATCGKCVFNSNHDACVSKFLKDVNARTKKPNVVPISTRKPKSQANKSVATPHKKTVASESTITNSKSYYRMLYKKTNKAWKWWIAQQCPSAYTWVPKTKRKWVPKVRNESVTKKIVQLILFIVDSGCTKHMTGNLSLLCNFVEKYLGTVRFGNDQFAPILGYGDLVQGNITIKRVYYVEGLNHNLFSVGQFCDADLEVAFRKSTCFVRDLQGNDLLTGNRGTDLYTISLQETTSSTPICLMAKASPTQAWLWHRRLSHLNFDYINLLSKKDVVIGLPKLKYVKDQLCSSCEVSKAKRSSFKSKTVPSSKGWLNLLHMDLCGPMRVATINGKKYILTLNAFFKEEGIEHQTSTPQTPQQNGVVKRRNRTLVEAARTMLSASKLPLFFWAEAIATACYTQNRSIIIPTHEKMAYHIINDKKPSIKHLYIFGCTCYLTRDGENLDKIKEKGDPCILVGYSTQSKGYRVYNKRTRLIVESIHLRFDEIKKMSETSVANDTSGLVLDLLFGPLYDEFFNDGTSRVNKSSSPTNNSAPQDTHPSTNIHPTSEPSTPTNVHAEENNNNQAEFTNPFCTPIQENAESSSRNIGNSNVHTFNQPQDSEYQWTKDHPLTQVRGNPFKPLQTR